MANGDSTGTEVVIRESVSKVMTVISSSLDDLSKQAAEFNKTIDQGLGEVEAHIHKVTLNVRTLGVAFSSASTSASTFARALGTAGLTGSMILLGRSLEHLATSTINLKYTSEEMGLTTQGFLKLQQAYQRLGYSAPEATSRIQGATMIMRDMGARGFASPYAQQLMQMGQGGTDLARQLIAINRTSGSTEEEFARLSEVMERATPAQRMYLSQFLHVPERLYDLNRAMRQNTGNVVANDAEMEKFNNAMVTLRTTLENVGTTIGGTLIEKLNELMGSLEKLGIFKDLQQWILHIDTDKLARQISDIAIAIGKLLAQLIEVKKWGDDAKNEKQDRKGVEGIGDEFGGQGLVEQDLRPEGWKSSNASAQMIEGGPLGWMKRVFGDQTIPLPQGRPQQIQQTIDLERDTNRILKEISDALTSGEGGPGTATGAAATGGARPPGSTTGGPSFDDSGLIAPGAVTAQRQDAYSRIRKVASDAGSPDPDYTASLAMHESGWLSNRGVYARSRYTNPFGQTVPGGGDASYSSLEEGVRAHVKRWGSYYGATAEETTANFRRGGYNVVNREWGSAVKGIYGRMTQQGARKTGSGPRALPGEAVPWGSTDPYSLYFDPTEIDRMMGAAGKKKVGDATVTVDVGAAGKDDAQQKDVFVPVRTGSSQQMPVPGGLDADKTRLVAPYQ